jgi:NitT/TauT family transport system substrate-binding protein
MDGSRNDRFKRVWWPAFRAGLRAAAAIAACAVSVSATAQSLTPLKVGTMKSTSQTPDYFAKKHGIFEKNGLAVTLTEFTNGSSAIAAGQSGAVDIMVAIPGIAMVAKQGGIDLVALFQIETAHDAPPDTGSLQVLANSEVKSLKDLTGKKVAVASLSSQNTISTQTVLQRGGVDTRTVQFVELPFPAMVNALKAGHVDAVSLIDPFTTQVASSGVGRILAWTYVDAIPGQPTSVWWAKTSFATRNADTVERFNKSIKEAIDALNADPDMALAEVGTYTGISPELLKQLPMPKWDYHVSKRTWETVIKMMADSGVLRRSLPVEDYLSEPMKQYLVTN